MGYSSPGTGVTVDGVTTIYWGTDSSMADANNGNAGYYIVLDISQEQVEAFRENLPNGNGITDTVVLGIDGVRWNLRVRDDSRMTPPNVGVQVYINNAGALPIYSGGSFITTRTRYRGRVRSASYNITPRSNGERTIVVERLTLVDS